MLQPVLQSPLAPPLQAPISDFGGLSIVIDGSWILATNFWVDVSQWNDLEIWND